MGIKKLLIGLSVVCFCVCGFMGCAEWRTEGKSAYELYCQAHPDYEGTEAEWLASLKGEQGAEGKSAYELYCQAHPDYEGTEEEWLASLKGEQGAEGKSAYELYCQAYPDYEGTEEEWLQALINGDFVVKTEYTVTFNPDNGEDCFTQQIQYGEKAERPQDPVRVGYVFNGWTYFDGVENEKWSFGGYSVTKDITLTAQWDYATYELPIINIDTDGENIDSKEDYTDMVFNLQNCEGSLTDVTGGIRLRGNSTMGYPKKPYRIKFDKKQSLFGLEKAKSWVLLAEYIDPSGLHNYTAFSLASQLSGLGFTPTPHKVNVYLNGSYAGLYTLCEQVQENEGRLDIELEEITEDFVSLKDYNFFVCMDYSVHQDPMAVLDETYYYIEKYGFYFELKYPEKSQFPTEEQFNSFFSQLKEYTEDILDAFAQKDIEKIKNETNVASLVDFLIVDQIMGERDHSWKSFNMYYASTSSNGNGKLNFGPIWDYDWSLYTPWTNSPNVSYEVSDKIEYSNLFYKAIVAIPEFYTLVKEKYNTEARDVLLDYLDEFDNLTESIYESLQLNNDVWYANLGENVSLDNVQFLKEFLENRIVVLDQAWAENE